MSVWSANDGGQAVGNWGPFPPAAKECYGIKIPTAAFNPIPIWPFNNPTFDISRTLEDPFAVPTPINLNGITSVVWSGRLWAFGGGQLVSPPPFGPIPAWPYELTGWYQILLDNILIGSGNWSGACAIPPGGGLYWGGQAQDIRDADTHFEQINRTETVGTVRFRGAVEHNLVDPGGAETRIAMEMYLLRST